MENNIQETWTFCTSQERWFQRNRPQLLSKCALRVFSGTRPSMGLDEQEEE